MSKKGYYLGGHSKEFGNPKMGFVSDDPYAHLYTKGLMKQRKKKAAAKKKAVVSKKATQSGLLKKPHVKIRGWRAGDDSPENDKSKKR